MSDAGYMDPARPLQVCDCGAVDSSDMIVELNTLVMDM